MKKFKLITYTSMSHYINALQKAGIIGQEYSFFTEIGEETMLIEIRDLEQLLSFGKMIAYDLIIDSKRNEILIYDTYIE